MPERPSPAKRHALRARPCRCRDLASLRVVMRVECGDVIRVDPESPGEIFCIEMAVTGVRITQDHSFTGIQAR